MTWRAETDQSTIDLRTMFTVYEEPWGKGVTVGALSPGNRIAVRSPNASTTAVEVISVATEEMVIQTTDGAMWRLVPATKQEKELAVKVGGDPPTLQCWIVAARC